MSDTYQPINVQMPPGDCVVLSDGRDALILTDVPHVPNFPPVKRAVIVARLRALADLIEAPRSLSDIASEVTSRT